MRLRGTKLYSIFTGLCPVCHKGEMYKQPNAYKTFKILEMHEYCSSCNLRFNMEPSFFFGAMYVSYAVGVAIAIATFIISYFFIGMDRNYTFLTITLVLVALLPLILRISRNIWINIFAEYREQDQLEKNK